MTENACRTCQGTVPLGFRFCPRCAPHGAGAPRGVVDLLGAAFTLYRTHARTFLGVCAVLFVPAAVVKALAGSVLALAPGASLWRLGLAGASFTMLLLYGVILPLTHGALTLAVADRILGGAASWREIWTLLFRRLGKLLSAVVPSTLLVLLGCLLLLIPGLVLATLYSLVAPVVLIEGVGGMAALRRSSALVRRGPLRVVLVLVTFALIYAVASGIAQLLVPTGVPFIGSLVRDAIDLLLLPIPILGSVLLYFDLRQPEGFGPQQLEAELAALRAG